MCDYSPFCQSERLYLYYCHQTLNRGNHFVPLIFTSHSCRLAAAGAVAEASVAATATACIVCADESNWNSSLAFTHMDSFSFSFTVSFVSFHTAMLSEPRAGALGDCGACIAFNGSIAQCQWQMCGDSDGSGNDQCMQKDNRSENVNNWCGSRKVKCKYND